VVAPVAKPFLNKAFAVGLLVAVTGVAFLVAFTFFKKGGYGERDSYRVHAYFDDITGITWKSRVQVAGIQIGEVDQVTLAGQRARLDLRVKKDIDLRWDACLTKRFPSALLPDALLEATLGTPGAPSLREAPEAEREITCVREAASVAKLLDSLAKVAADIQVVSADIAKTVGGPESIREIMANLARVTRTIDQVVGKNAEGIGAIVENARAFTGELRSVAEQDRERYHAIARNVEEASTRLNSVLATVQNILGANQPELKESAQGLRQALEKLNRSLDQVEQATNRIAEGKGVAGKLLADERLGEKLGSTIENYADYADRLFKLQVQVQFRSEWLLNQKGSKTYAGFRLIPRPDKYYLLEIVSDPRGVNTVTTETVTTLNTSNVSTKVLNEQKVSFSLEFAKRYGPVTLRIGLIESTGGLGGDLHLFDDHLQISLDVFQFQRLTQDVFPRAKLWANYSFLNHFYVTVGTDDVLNKLRSRQFPLLPNFVVGRDLFFGGGLYFTDQDLKALIGAGGSSAASAVR
jgi:phospholipid/cholesterol/gamma-HCH transport system substrate-binding protein